MPLLSHFPVGFLQNEILKLFPQEKMVILDWLYFSVLLFVVMLAVVVISAVVVVVLLLLSTTMSSQLDSEIYNIENPYSLFLVLSLVLSLVLLLD